MPARRSTVDRARVRPVADAGAHAAHGRPTAVTRFRSYWISHLQMLLSSLGRLWRTPVASLMTAAVIGIALALPSGLHVLLSNAQRLSDNWDGSSRISVFLKDSVSDDQARELAGHLRNLAGIGEVRTISRAQALAEFRRLSGFGDALKALDTNPLPAVLVVRPALALTTPAQIQSLVEKLRQLPQVHLAQLDIQWVRRLHAIVAIAQRAVLVLGAILGLAVLLIVGNTIRLDIQNRRQEIEVIKLVGATDAFIRRPFLYGGMWYGLFGGAIAWLLVALALWLLGGPVERLAALYDSAYGLRMIDLPTTVLLFITSAALGLFGSWIAVGRHLRAIEPT